MRDIRLLREDAETQTFEVYQANPSACLFSRTGGGTCRGQCGQPRNYKLKCEQRGHPFSWREITVKRLSNA